MALAAGWFLAIEPNGIANGASGSQAPLMIDFRLSLSFARDYALPIF
jgi:hypothetical protein